jgi:hypothetical protein
MLHTMVAGASRGRSIRALERIEELPMIWLGLLVIVVGSVLMLMILQVPRRVIVQIGEAEVSKQRIAALDAGFAQVSEMRARARLLFEGAVHRGDPELQQDELNALVGMGALCEKLVAELHGMSAILERYFQNHIAVLSHVVNAHDNKTGLSEALTAALLSLDRSQAAEHSEHPIAVLERRLATGRGVT